MHLRQSGVPAHSAVGLAGVAPRLVPSRGHAALIPDALASTSFLACALGLPMRDFVEGGLGGGLLCPLTVPRRARRQGLRASGACGPWPSATPDCLRCAVLASVPGNSARVTGEQP